MPSSVRNDRLPPYRRSSPGHAGKFRHRAQAAEQTGVVPGPRLDLDRQQLAAAAEQEVHLGASRGVRAPVADLLVEVGLLAVRPKQVQDPSFEQRAPLLRRHGAVLPLRRPNQPRVDPVELRVTALANPQLRLVRRQPVRQQRVFQDVQVALHGGSGHAAVAREPRDVDGGAMAESGDRQEAGEAGQIPHQRFGADLLAQVELHVALQRGAPVLRRPDERDRPGPKRRLEIEVAAQFRGRQRVHRPAQRPPGQQIHAGRLQLARARPQEREAEPALLDEPVNLVQQVRQALDLVDDDPAFGRNRPQLRREQGGIDQVVLVASLVEEIDPVSVGRFRRAQVLLPTPRTPRRKKLRLGRRESRG